MNKITAILVGALAWTASLALAEVQPFVVLGWPLPDLSGAVPVFSDGDDAVVGRQICPSLTRLDLSEKKSEELLLKRVRNDHASSGHAVVFRYELRSGLFWWSGQAVTAEALAEYLRAQLRPLVARRSAGMWTVPNFEVLVDGPLEVSVHFEQEPVFGPFILNGAPFFRSVGAAQKPAFAFECVGLYRPERRPFGLLLVPTEGYKSNRELVKVELYNPAEKPLKLPPQFIELRYPNQVKSVPNIRLSDKGAGCATMLELPQMAMIVWNTHSGPMANPALRRALSQLIPRTALVAAGAAYLAEVAVSPVPREHPGYQPLSLVQGFDLHAVSVALNGMGYRRKTAGAPRLSIAGEPLKLTLGTAEALPNVLEKVLSDSFSAVGIGLEFRLKGQQGKELPPLDGTLAAFAIDWPDVNLLGNFHQASVGRAPFMPLDDADLDRHLERYAVSLTTAVPDFNSLMQVQKRLAELEPITVLFRQKACLVSGSALSFPKGSLNQRDPDWFRHLLF